MVKVILDEPGLIELFDEGITLKYSLGNKDQIKAKIESVLKASSIMCEEVKVY